MPVKIRLMRIGAKKRPFYRVVAVDERKKRTGEYLELLGTYNPLTQPKEIILKKDRIDWWTKQGATPSNGYLRIIGKAPQKSPRKPKKAKKEEASGTKPSPEAQEGGQELDKKVTEETAQQEVTEAEAIPSRQPEEESVPESTQPQAKEEQAAGEEGTIQ